MKPAAKLPRMIPVLALTLLKTETIIADGRLVGLENNIVAVQTSAAVYKGLATPKTRFWIDGRPSELRKFAINMPVRARLRSDASGVELRELCDGPSALLLEKIRTTYLEATVARVDSQGYWFNLPTGVEHFYKTTKSTKIDRTVLKEGDKVFVKGRMLTSLDTALAHAAEQAPPPAPGLPGDPIKPPKPMPPSVPIDDPRGVPVKIVSLMGQMTMFDVEYEGRRYHITFDRYTLFLDGKKPVPFDDSWYGQNVRLRVRRDRFSRLMAIRVTR